jgi:hypothetical protein
MLRLAVTAAYCGAPDAMPARVAAAAAASVAATAALCPKLGVALPTRPAVDGSAGEDGTPAPARTVRYVQLATCQGIRREAEVAPRMGRR